MHSLRPSFTRTYNVQKINVIEACKTVAIMVFPQEGRSATRTRCRKIKIVLLAVAIAFIYGVSVLALSGVLNTNQNPGCSAGNLLSYRPRSGPEYFHPNVVHYMKLAANAKQGDHGTINFLEYASMLSFHSSLNPDKIIIHSNMEKFSGQYWDMVQKWTASKVELHKISIPPTIGGKKWKYVEHVADYLKLVVVKEYGGIATDFDVFVLNGTSIVEQRRRAECFLSCEGFNCITINAGFYSCSKQSKYIDNLMQKYNTDYHPEEWLYNAGYVPTAMLTSGSACYNVYVDYTIVGDPYGADDASHWLRPGGVDWKNRSILHVIVRNLDIMKLDRQTIILNGNSSFSELIRTIVYNS